MPKYTDEQIKKAVECCIDYENLCGEECPFYETDCTGTDNLYKHVLDRFNRQEAEKADLQDEIKCEKETNKHLNDEYIALLKKCNCQEAEIERLQSVIAAITKDRDIEHECHLRLLGELKTAKSEAIKEYKKKILSLFPEDQCCTTIAKATLNIFEKEMVGEGE